MAQFQPIVLLKRHFGTTISEVMGATKYFKEKPMIIERGVNTFDRHDDMRWRIDCLGIAELKQADFKVIADVSHSTGKSEYVLPMAMAAMGAGADGIMIECRENPKESWSDKRQCVNLIQLEKLIKEVRKYAGIFRID